MFKKATNEIIVPASIADDYAAINVDSKVSASFSSIFCSPFYQILSFFGTGHFRVDFTDYPFSGNTILFLSPYQSFQWKGPSDIPIEHLTFHADFYCIEYHKKEVACNGLLFNNIYLQPHIKVDDECINEIVSVFKIIRKEKERGDPLSNPILRAYLQVILAVCSKQKTLILKTVSMEIGQSRDILTFQQYIEQSFLTERSVSFYADKFSLTINAFSKRIKRLLGKTPSQLIQERLILEAKKKLHLTTKQIKEIAYELHFEDEFYFSRFFKKNVGISPLHYRETVGISIVAE